METVQSLGKGGESAFIFIQSYLITSKTHMLEISFADAEYFSKPEYVYQGHDGRRFIFTLLTFERTKSQICFQSIHTL